MVNSVSLIWIVICFGCGAGSSCFSSRDGGLLEITGSSIAIGVGSISRKSEGSCVCWLESLRRFCRPAFLCGV